MEPSGGKEDSFWWPSFASIQRQKLECGHMQTTKYKGYMWGICASQYKQQSQKMRLTIAGPRALAKLHADTVTEQARGS